MDRRWLPGCVLRGMLVLLLISSLRGRIYANETETLRIATLAPKSSECGRVFVNWAQAVSTKTGGRITLEINYNGRLGDESAMVSKMQNDQLDGGLFGEVGLGKICQPALVFQLPGLFTKWAELDVVRAELNAKLEQGAEASGFRIIGWTDFGVRRTMSKGFTVRKPADIRGRKPHLGRGDIIQSMLYEAIEGVSPVPLNIPEVLPSLKVGDIDIVTTSALQAEQFQWSAHLDSICSQENAYLVGAVAFSLKRLRALPEDLRNVLIDTGITATAAMTQRLRQEDAAAYLRLKNKMTVIDYSGKEQAEWNDVYSKMRRRMAPAVFPFELMQKLETAPSKQ